MKEMEKMVKNFRIIHSLQQRPVLGFMQECLRPGNRNLEHKSLFSPLYCVVSVFPHRNLRISILSTNSALLVRIFLEPSVMGFLIAPYKATFFLIYFYQPRKFSKALFLIVSTMK